MRKLWAVAVNTLAELRQQRIIWIVVVMAALLALTSVTPLLFLDRVRAAGQSAIAGRLGVSIIEGMIQAWATAAYVLAAFQGSSAVTSELHSKTIVTVLARPLARWQYLLGRLVGIQTMALGFFALGLIAAPLIAAWFGLTIDSSFWLHVAKGIVAILYASTVSLALGIVAPSQAAAAITLLLPILPTLTSTLAQLDNEAARTVAWLAFVLCPAAMPDNVIGAADAQLIQPRYDLFAMVLGENLLYAASVLLIGCWWFGRREIRLAS